MIQNILNFLKHDLWRIPRQSLKPLHSVGVYALRVVVLSAQDFNKDKCYLRASALTFYTLLSLVPVVAMAFGVAQGFHLEELLEKQLYREFAGQEEVIAKVIGFARGMLEQTHGGLIAGLGVLTLFWTVVKVLGHIESALNEIWGVQGLRSWSRKLVDYLAFMMICPVLVVVSSSVSVFISAKASQIFEYLSFLGPLSSVSLWFLLKILPLLMAWSLFTFIYSFMPKCKVPLRSAFMGALLAGTLYHVLQVTYIHFQLQVSNYGAIYGSFAALPFFLLWVQLSWIIALLGAELAFAHQYADTFELEPDSQNISLHLKALIALRLFEEICQDFREGKSPRELNEVAKGLHFPIRLSKKLMSEFASCGLLNLVAQEGQVAYVPARDVHEMDWAFVLKAWCNHGQDRLPVPEDPCWKRLQEHLKFLQTN